MLKQQLTDLVIIPTIKEIPHGYSEEAVLAAQMIIAHESSGGEYIKQLGGPALGVTQMEPDTHDDVWKHGDSIWDNAVTLGIINENKYSSRAHPNAKRLIYDMRYCIFMLRQKLFMAPSALPSDPSEMAAYLKLNWNGGGKATATKYHWDWQHWD
mgnify:CR=1 FL=1|tara:strand:+ start:4586 stop:5050 length:465 start_codon:yes stop_codon:yes gene_type:complete